MLSSIFFFLGVVTTLVEAVPSCLALFRPLPWQWAPWMCLPETAVCLVILAGALFFLRRRRETAARCLSAIPFVYGVIGLCDSITHSKRPLTQIFPRFVAEAGDIFPRYAVAPPLVAICFLVITIWVLSSRSEKMTPKFEMAFMTCMIPCMTAIAIILCRVFAWVLPDQNFFFFLAQPTWLLALITLFFSLSILFNETRWTSDQNAGVEEMSDLRGDPQQAGRRRLAYGVLSSLTVFAGVLVLASVIHTHSMEDQRKHVEFMALSLGDDIKQRIGERAETLRRMTYFWDETEGTSRAAWQIDADKHVAEGRDLVDQGWMGENIEPNWMASHRELEYLQRHLGNETNLRAEFQKARGTGEVRASGPIRLLGGETGFFLIAPIGVSPQHTRIPASMPGFLVEVYDFEKFLTRNPLFSNEPWGKQISIDQEPIYLERPENLVHPALNRWRQTVHFTILNHVFEIQLVPSLFQVRAMQSGLSGVVLMAGSLVSVLLGLVLIYAVGARQESYRLEKLAGFRRVLLDHSDVGILTISAQGRISSVNAVMEQLSGLSAKALDGQSVLDFLVLDEVLKEELRRKFNAKFGMASDVADDSRLESAPQEAISYNVESEWRRENLTGFPIELALAPLPLRQDQFEDESYICVVRDLSFRRSQERMLQEHRIKLAASSKMVSLGEMAAGIAHEINNPLAILQGRSEQISSLLGRSSIDAEKLLEASDRIQLTVQRIARIVLGLRRFARDGDGDPIVPTHLFDVISETVALCDQKIRSSGIDLRINLPVEQPMVPCRSVQISQVLLNLLSNSTHAVESLAERWIEIDLSYDSTHAKLRVVDSGRGIPTELRHKIFDPFFTTKPLGVGTGLGLSISKGIIEEHSGRLSYRLNENERTEFRIELPIHREKTSGKLIPLTPTAVNAESERRLG